MAPVSLTSSDKNCRILAEDHVFVWRAGPRRYRMRVPKGYEYEVSGSSLFHAFLVGVAPYYTGEDVAAGHDWAYDHHGNVEVWAQEAGVWFPLRRPLTKLEIDKIMLSDPGDPVPAKWLLYAGVRLFGWWKWNGWEEWKNEWWG